MTALERPQRWWLATLPYIALTLSQWDYVPMWDARLYANCLVRQAQAAFDPHDYVCWTHPLLVWGPLVSAPGRLWPNAYLPFLLVSIGLGVLGLRAFHRLASRLPGIAPSIAWLLTLCLGVWPTVVSGTVDVNPDFGVLAFFLCMLDALASGELPKAALFGVLATFCKETGALLTAGLAAGTLAAEALSMTPKPRLTWAQVRARLPLLTGPVLLVIWLVFFHQRMGFEGFLARKSQAQLFAELVSLNPLDETHLAQLLMLFVFNFAWVFTVIAGARWVRLLARRLRGEPTSVSPIEVFVDLVVLTVVLCSTRYRTQPLARYFVTFAPALLLSAALSLKTLSSRTQRVAWLALGALLLCASVRSFDPVTRALWGTFAFGEHELYAVDSIPGTEHFGYGVAGLAYNLQHTELSRLQDLAYADLRPSGVRRLAAHEVADTPVIGNLDAVTHQRTLDPTQPRWQTLDPYRVCVEGERPERLLFVRFPNFPDIGWRERLLERWYAPVQVHRYEHHGYALEVLELVRK
ncbi:MAG: hypothetical protein JST92_21385 [Deltaproteobacteria bacterium]|nr:hypothetical protein [Deltaproteobacteria bacterium]